MSHLAQTHSQVLCVELRNSAQIQHALNLFNEKVIEESVSSHYDYVLRLHTYLIRH